ncbi:MAG: pilus assembly protein [Ahrensia sp.]|nr:pilus assembly protein [Ahrensia sp.]
MSFAAAMYRRFRKDQRGASVIEFALIAFPFLATLVAVFELSMKGFMQSSLDQQMFLFAQKISRESTANVSKADYRTNVVCADLPLMLRCDQLVFGAEAFDPLDGSLEPSRNNVFADGWSTGCSSSTVVLEMLYPVPHIFLPWAVADVVQYNGADHFRSRGVVRREPLTEGSGTLSNGASC